MGGVGKTPTENGELSWYQPDPACAETNVPAMYVNGMITTGETHRDTCVALADAAGCPVLGIYNLYGGAVGEKIRAIVDRVASSDLVPRGIRDRLVSLGDKAASGVGFVEDVGECLEQWVASASQDAIGRVLMKGATDWIGGDAKRSIVRWLFSDFPPTLRLIEQVERLLAKDGAARVVCHSQGNLITCNALEALLWIRKPEPLGDVRVFGLASPVPKWPSAVVAEARVRLYTFAEDPITWLSLLTSFTRARQLASSGQGVGLDSHAVDLYLEQSQAVQDLRADLGLARVTDRTGPGGIAPYAAERLPGYLG